MPETANPTPSRVRMLAGQVQYANRTTLRNPLSAFFTIAFPLVFLLIFNLLSGSQSVAGPGGAGQVSFAQFFTPGIAAFGIVAACYINLAISTVTARDLGILKRVRGTPLPPLLFLVGRILSSVLFAFASVVVMTAVAMVLFDVVLPTDTLPAIILTVLAGSACFCALALAVTAIVPSAEAAPPIVNVTVFPLMFISGIFFPTQGVAAWINTVANIFPIKRLANALQVAYNPATAAPGVQWGDLAVIAAWTVAGLIIGLRFFRWESPR
jgi:ABC-2 type transport system permease protein